MTARYFKYWGKARQGDDPPSQRHHLLVYHCLDVAAVADAWWRQSAPLRRLFCNDSSFNEEQTRALLLFFVALHDLGKLDIRFQLKAPDVLADCWPEFAEDDADPDTGYYHGPEGFYVFRKQIQKKYSLDFDTISPWLKAVCGHHGDVHFQGTWHSPEAEDWVIEHDAAARAEWVRWLQHFFLDRAGVTLKNPLPPAPSILAGFCAVCDWVGSNDLFFRYRSGRTGLEEYWHNAATVAGPLIKQMGLYQDPSRKTGMRELFPAYVPRQLQNRIDQLPGEAGLTIVEGPTGSGKTEAAIAYASRLIDSGVADSIIFALPTQVTANAMLERLEDAATRLFEQAPNLVLAHGRAQFNPGFEKLKQAAGNNDIQTDEQERAAQAQCVKWLGESRKRIFLGQIGVCTVDQVLASVLPVRHNFVRQFGLQKSVLIIDEVHAYDAYMYGLLNAVLRRQHDAGGAAVLLSATLPQSQRLQLVNSYAGGAQGPARSGEPYPLISFVGALGNEQRLSLDADEQPQEYEVTVEQVITPDVMPDEPLMDRIAAAADRGALVGIVCNIVADAQRLHHQLVDYCRRQGMDVPVDLFHARFRFEDRQTHELGALEDYGKLADRSRGRILVATQVIEQSLDLDFDWMITQICPVDLLFQRLGRLHRHPRANRPAAFQQPGVVVLAPRTDDFGVHEYVYATSRLLWRTRELLAAGRIRFPAAYRDWIEKVYEDPPWPDEPDAVTGSHDEYWAKCRACEQEAKRISRAGYRPFDDTDGKVALMTRDGDMNLNLLLVQDAPGTVLLDGEVIEELEDWQQNEALQLNTVPVPASWKRMLPTGDDSGLIRLPMRQTGGQWFWQQGNDRLAYTPDRGLERAQQ